MSNVPKLRFKEFNDEWEEKNFKQFILNHKGGAPLKPKDFVSNSNYEVIPKKAIQSGGKLLLDKESPTFCTEDFFRNNQNNVIDSKYLVTTLRDLVPSGPSIGYIVKNANTSDLLLVQGVYGFRINDKLSESFLIQLSNRLEYRRLMQRLMVGSTQVHIRNQDFFQISLNLPSKQEQEKIASFLNQVDTKIEQLTTKEELLQQYKKGVMQKIFNQEIRFKADDGSEFCEWKEKKLEDFLNLTLREVPKPNDNYLAIGIRSHCKGTFQKPDSEPEKIAMDKLYVVKENDLIVNITFAWESAIAIVKKEDEGGLVSHRFPTYTFNKDLAIVEFFRYVIIQKKFRLMLDLISPGGAGRNRVMSKKDFLKLKWELPCVKEQSKIANFLSSIDTKIEQVQKQLESSKEFKKALLQQMFV